MTDDISDIEEYYKGATENEHARLERHQLEHELTWRYFDRYLPSEGAILEIGAATGRYTLDLARRGYQVTAVDLSSAELEICRKLLIEQGLQANARLFVVDARDLSPVEGDRFDAALVMGPLYHLVVESDRKLVLQGVIDRLKPGGMIFSAFISRYGILGDLLKNVPEWIENQAEVQSILEVGKDPDHYPRGTFRGYFAKVAEIAPLHEQLGFETIAVVGVEPAISADDESYNRLTGKQRELWLDLLYQIGAEESIIGASRHFLYIGRKRSE